METKSTNEVKGDYDRVSASECLGSLIELHGIVMEDDLFVIPDADGTAVLYNDGKIRFDEIADIEVGSQLPSIRNLYRLNYLFPAFPLNKGNIILCLLPVKLCGLNHAALQKPDNLFRLLVHKDVLSRTWQDRSRW